ncbi:unnamed protein product [Prunus armeniaca]
MTFSNFWTQSGIDWSVKLDNSGSYEFTQNSPNDSSHNIMTFSKFWTQSGIDWSVKLDNSGSYEFWTQSDTDWSMKLDNSGSYEVRSKMEWLVYCIVLAIGLHSKLTK